MVQPAVLNNFNFFNSKIFDEHLCKAAIVVGMGGSLAYILYKAGKQGLSNPVSFLYCKALKTRLAVASLAIDLFNKIFVKSRAISISCAMGATYGFIGILFLIERCCEKMEFISQIIINPLNCKK